MDHYRLRAERVRALIHDRFDGSYAAFAEATGIAATTVSRWFMKGTGRKNIGEDNARKIEDILRIAPGSLVWPSAIDPVGVVPLHKAWPFTFPRERIDRLNSEQRARIDERVAAMLERFEEEAKTDRDKRRG